MNEHPQFEIVKQIGHGQFSNVFKAKWLNAPITTTTTTTTNSTSTIISLDNPLYKYPSVGSFHCNVPENHRSIQSNINSANQEHIINYNHNLKLNNSNNNNNNVVLESNNYILKDHHANFNQDNLVNKRQKQVERYVALKEINFYDIPNSTSRMDCLKEVRLLQQLNHPNIINYNISFIQAAKLFIVLELADGGDLSKLIKYYQKKGQIISERIILKYFTQVCSAVDYIHSKRILHRDIKPANIFMTSDGVVKLGDFGLGRFFSQNTRDAHSIVGTFYYMSPERIRELGYGFSSDIWSLGCVLYELITLNSPFCIFNFDRQNKKPPAYNNNTFPQQRNQQQNQLLIPSPSPPSPPPPPPPPHQQNPTNLQWLIDRILRADYPSLANYQEISPRLRQLTTECLNPNPDARPNMEYICNVTNEAYIIQQQISSTPRNSQDFTAMPCGI